MKNILLSSLICVTTLSTMAFDLPAAHIEDTSDFGETVEFHIPNGTGENAWNTPQSLIDLKVGQTLRIINDDSVTHRLHTFGKPCPHQPNDSQTGEFYDCKLATSIDPRVDILYDHNHGSTARFYIRVTR